MKNVPGIIQMLEDLDIPIRSVVRESSHIDDQKVPSEWMYPGWLGNMSFELTLRVDVENKAAARGQMLAHLCEHSFPLREASNVINRIEYAQYCVKLLADLEIDHVLAAQLCPRDLLSRNREHLAGEIQARNVVIAL